MKTYEFNGIKYELVNDSDNIFDYEVMKEKITDYFSDYDYIFGDLAYNKIRLKGFYSKENKKMKEINNFEKLNDYIINYCAYGCSTFLLKKVK